VTLVTFLKYVNGFFWHGDFNSWVARELAYTLLNVYLIASHLLE
jgi:hypothetical protein